MPKSTKRFILSTEKLNSHGFRVITAGIDLTDFKKNPVMYWMHDYPTGENIQKALPIGYWDDIQVNGTELSAVPVFDDSDPFAMKIYNKVEHGTIRAASVALNPVKIDTDKSNWVTGQKLPTLLKSTIGEASIVDRGSNADAVTLNSSGSQSFLRMAQASLYQLYTPNVDEAALADDLLTDDDCGPEMAAICKMAVNSGKITNNEAGHFKTMAAKSPQMLDAVKETIRNTPIKPENITGKFHHKLISQAAENSFDDIQNKMPGGFTDLKRSAPDLYKAKFFEKHGRLPAVV